MKAPHRIVWAFAAGYFAVYAPYCTMVKTLTTGPSASRGMVLLPAVIAGTALSALATITALGWWKYWRRPSLAMIGSGAGTAAIVATTTLAYTFSGVSVVLALLLMRGGVLLIAPLADLAFGRTVRWFSWTALAISVAALVVALADAGSYALPLAAGINLAAYLAGYVIRLATMTRTAKQDDPALTRTYFVQELVVTLAFLAAVPALLALAGHTDLRAGFAVFRGTPLLAPALMAGVLYTGVFFFGTLIYLDKRENTFCIPLNRGSSLLAGAFVSLAGVGGLAFPSLPQLVAASMVILALMLLSPVHHIFELRPARDVREIGVPR